MNNISFFLTEYRNQLAIHNGFVYFVIDARSAGFSEACRVTHCLRSRINGLVIKVHFFHCEMPDSEKIDHPSNLPAGIKHYFGG